MAGWFEHSLLLAHKATTQMATLYRCCVKHGIDLLTMHVATKQVKNKIQALIVQPADSRRSCKQVWQIGEEGSASNHNKLSTYNPNEQFQCIKCVLLV